MKTIVIGDIHGQFEIVDRFLDVQYTSYNKVFVGDYLDSFHRKPVEQVDALRKVLHATMYRDDVIGLLGNHEVSYLEQNLMASGWRGVTDAAIMPYKTDMLWYMKPYTWVGEYLVTHAGVSKGWLDQIKFFYPDLAEKPIDYIIDNISLLDQGMIGHCRGGRGYGGIYWNDWYGEFDPIPELKQVVGHTARRKKGDYEGIIEREGSFNIDCLPRVNEVLVIDDETNITEVLKW